MKREKPGFSFFFQGERKQLKPYYLGRTGLISKGAANLFEVMYVQIGLFSIEAIELG